MVTVGRYITFFYQVSSTVLYCLKVNVISIIVVYVVGISMVILY